MTGTTMVAGRHVVEVVWLASDWVSRTMMKRYRRFDDDYLQRRHYDHLPAGLEVSWNMSVNMFRLNI